jgi:hypothetical protein
MSASKSRKKESSFSEEKEAKRLLVFGITIVGADVHHAKEQKSFASFLQKRRPYTVEPLF